METTHDIVVNNKRGVQFKFSIHRKFTIIRGDSATGKTTFFQMINDAASTRVSGVTVSCDVPVRPLNESGYLLELQMESNRIYVVDEDFGALKSKEFAKALLQSNNCFILITRESLPTIPYSYKEIYGIKTSGKFHSLERIYPDYDEFRNVEMIITEDEDAGLEYYKYFCGDKVKTSRGNSNLSKYGSPDSLLIGDGCAIGAYIQDLLLTKATLYLPESFEYSLLKKGMFRHKKEIQEFLEAPERKVGTEYASMERYCTTLLMDITRNTPAQYGKSHLNECYMKNCCCKGSRCEFFTRENKF